MNVALNYFIKQTCLYLLVACKTNVTKTEPYTNCLMKSYVSENHKKETNSQMNNEENNPTIPVGSNNSGSIRESAVQK